MKRYSAVALGVTVLTVVALTIVSSPSYQTWRGEQKIKEESAEIMKEIGLDRERYLRKLSDRQRLGLDSAPNGKPWPESAGYLEGYSIGDANGLSQVYIRNSSSADVFLKLYKKAGETQEASRHLFVPSHEQFKMGQISPGQYIMRYLNLSNGKVFQQRSIVIEESTSNLGTKISTEHIFIRDSGDPLFSAIEVSPAEF